jgi:hypothetical protein
MSMQIATLIDSYTYHLVLESSQDRSHRMCMRKRHLGTEKMRLDTTYVWYMPPGNYAQWVAVLYMTSR